MNRSVTFDEREAMCILMQYEIELMCNINSYCIIMYTFGIIAFKFICIIFSFI